MNAMKPRILALAALLAASLAAGAAEPVPGADVASLLAVAREHNPEFAAARLEAEAAGERPESAGALPDPVLRVELENLTNNGMSGVNVLPSRVGDTKYTVMQPLPLWGKRELRREVAKAEADAAGGRAADAWLDLSTRIKGAYADYWQLTRNEALTREILDLMTRLESIAQVRYAGGLAAQQDAIRAQVERTSMQAELIALESERHHMMVTLNNLLARPATAPLADPQGLPPLPAEERLDEAALAERVQRRNPQLQAEAARIGAAEKSRELTYRGRYPDLTVGVVPTQVGSSVATWGLMLETSIPLQQSARRSQERESERMLDAARARAEATGVRLQGELSQALSALYAARRTEDLTAHSLLPQAELTFRSALAGYENGKVDFATLLDAQRQIRVAKQNIIKARATQAARLADIERLVGEEL